MFNTADDATVRQVLQLLNVSIEQFCEIDAVSEAQRNFANDLKIRALAMIWESLSEEKQTIKSAQAIVQAIMEQKEARFWLDNQYAWSQAAGARARLRDGIARHLKGESNAN